MSAFGIPADLADFPILDLPALDILGFEKGDILVYLPALDNLGLEFEDTSADLADFSILDLPALDILFDLSTPGILYLEIDDILGLDILVDMSTFDLPADVFADFLLLDMLDILDHSC